MVAHEVRLKLVAGHATLEPLEQADVEGGLHDEAPSAHVKPTNGSARPSSNSPAPDQQADQQIQLQPEDQRANRVFALASGAWRASTSTIWTTAYGGPGEHSQPTIAASPRTSRAPVEPSVGAQTAMSFGRDGGALRAANLASYARSRPYLWRTGERWLPYPKPQPLMTIARSSCRLPLVTEDVAALAPSLSKVVALAAQASHQDRGARTRTEA